MHDCSGMKLQLTDFTGPDYSKLCLYKAVLRYNSTPLRCPSFLLSPVILSFVIFLATQRKTESNDSKFSEVPRYASSSLVHTALCIIALLVPYVMHHFSAKKKSENSGFPCEAVQFSLKYSRNSFHDSSSSLR